MEAKLLTCQKCQKAYYVTNVTHVTPQWLCACCGEGWRAIQDSRVFTGFERGSDVNGNPMYD